MENNTAPPAIFPAKSATAYEWHQLMAHVHNKAIQHLPVAAEGVVVSNKNKVPPTNKCETCALSKAYRIVSRSPAKSETSNKPFFRVTYDLIQMNTALNKDEWISYLADNVYDFQIIFTHRYKSTAFNAVRKGIIIIRVRYGAIVVFLRSNRESSLGQAFQDLIAELGIT